MLIETADDPVAAFQERRTDPRQWDNLARNRYPQLAKITIPIRLVSPSRTQGFEAVAGLAPPRVRL